MLKPRTLLLLLPVILVLAWFSSSGYWKKSYDLKKPPVQNLSSGRSLEKIEEKARQAKIFAVQNGYNKAVCFLVDMSLPSGQNRFFVYDLEGDSLQNAGLVTHGRCNENWLEGRKYGNKVGCGCTSLGKYKIGYSYTGRFGLAFKLYGLDRTNDKAFERFVVLHSHECVPESEVKDEICQSDGCPTVAPGFLKELKNIIQPSGKPLLLWIYD